MNKLFYFGIAGALLLFLGVTPLVAQEVVFTAGPAVTPTLGGSNGGFAWLDLNGDGTQDVFIPPNNVLLNHITFFTAVSSTKTVNLSANVNSVGGLFADFNGDGVPDIFSTNNGAPATGLFYDSSGVYVVPTVLGDLPQGGVTGEVFQGAAAGPIDHSNYLSLAWPGTFTNIAASTGPWSNNGGIYLFKGGPAGFTNIGKGATASNVAIDTTKSFESWDVHFFDANNDGYQDLFMPSFRNGYSKVDTGTSGPRKGCVLFLNDGTGRFKVPTSASYRRIDSLRASTDGSRDSVTFTSLNPDTGIVVDDTVRHFAAIGSQWGDLNNDGNVDLILTGLAAGDNRTANGLRQQIVVLYGKGDGTFTDKWNGTNYVSSGLPTSGSIRAWDIGDYNNDGIPDVYASTTFGATRLFRGNGNGTFTEVTAQDYVATAGGGRAGGFVDYDNDGFLDIYNYTGLNSVLQKSSGNSNHWIGFIPVGTGHNLNAIGAVFTLYTQGGTFKQARYIRAEAGSAGHGEMRALFGIGINTSIDRVDVKWPDGTSASYTGLAVDKYWTVKEGSAIPGTAALVAPANGTTGVAVSGSLSWTAATGAVSYQVQVSLDPTFANKLMLAVNATVNGTSYAYNLGAATKYYWRVAAVNAGFMSAYTAANSFTTTGAAAAVVPTQLSPANKATNQAAVLALKVGRTSDASRYQWQVATLPTFTTFFANDSTADTTFTTQFVGGQTFYWRVRGMNDLGRSAFSPIDTFTVMTPPARTTLVSPANSAQNVITDSVVFVWRLVSTAASYNMQLSTVTSTTTYTGITDTTYKVKGLARLTNYTWKVEALNAGGTSYFTGANTFTTVVANPAVPSAVLPASAAVNVNRATKFVWNSVLNATKYRLQVATDNAFASVVRDSVINIDTTATLQSPLSATTDYYWRVKALNIGGESDFSTARLFTTGTVLAVDDKKNEIPQVFALNQNYPNPFNPTTTISYDVPKASYVKIVIYDVLGRIVTTLVDGPQAANRYTVVWNASNVGTGVYFYRMTAKGVDGSGDFTSVKKLLLMR